MSRGDAGVAALMRDCRGQGPSLLPASDAPDAAVARAWLRHALSEHAVLQVRACRNAFPYAPHATHAYPNVDVLQPGAPAAAPAAGGGGARRARDATVGIRAPELVGIVAQRATLLGALSRTLAGGGGEFVLLVGAR